MLAVALVRPFHFSDTTSGVLTIILKPTAGSGLAMGMFWVIDSLGSITGIRDMTARGPSGRSNAGVAGTWVDRSGGNSPDLMLSVSERLGAKSIFAEKCGRDGCANTAHEVRRSRERDPFICIWTIASGVSLPNVKDQPAVAADYAFLWSRRVWAKTITANATSISAPPNTLKAAGASNIAEITPRDASAPPQIQ